MKKISFLICLSLMALELSACTKNADSYGKGNTAELSNSYWKVYEQEEITDMVYEKQPNKLSKIKMSNIYDTEEIVEFEDTDENGPHVLRTKVNNYYYSKTIPEGIDREEIYMVEYEVTDETGNLLNDRSYFVCDITIFNDNDIDIAPYLSMFQIVELGSDMYIQDQSVELRYRSGKEEYAKKNYYEQFISAKSSYDVTLVYIINDTIIESGNVYLLINAAGIAEVDDCLAIKLEV